MKTEYKITNLDCANCAKKLERAIQKHSDIISADIVFMTQKLIVESNLEGDKLTELLNTIIARTEPEAEIEQI